MTEINYVVARPWRVDDPQRLAVYAMGGQIQRGCLQDAQEFLDRVNRQHPNLNYQIYRVEFHPVCDSCPP